MIAKLSTKRCFPLVSFLTQKVFFSRHYTNQLKPASLFKRTCQLRLTNGAVLVDDLNILWSNLIPIKAEIIFMFQLIPKLSVCILIVITHRHQLSFIDNCKELIHFPSSKLYILLYCDLTAVMKSPGAICTQIIASLCHQRQPQCVN